MRKFSKLLFFIFSLSVANAQEKLNLINSPAPKVVFQKSLGKPIAADFYKNKILVLDFWATWCAPCIATFPEFNKLSKKYSSNSVLFAAITDEQESTVIKFFKRTKKELNSIKLIDTSKKTGIDFNILTIPRCVIIDKDNIVRWQGESYNLTDNILSKIIKNEPAAQQSEILQISTKLQNKPIASRALFSFSVARSDSTKRSYEGGGSATNQSNYIQLDIINSSLEDCLQQLSGFSKAARIFTNDSSRMKQMIDMDFKAGRDTSLFNYYENSILPKQARRNLIITLLGQSLKFNAFLSSKKQKHYELVIVDSSKLHTFKSMQYGHNSFSNNHFPKFVIVGYDLKDITVELEGSLKTAIVTNIQHKERYDLSLDVSNVEKANKSLQFHGLKLKEVNDEIQYLNINFY